MDFTALTKDIFSIDQKIRFITIVDAKGKVIHSVHREGVTSSLNKRESKKSLKQIVKFWRTNNDFVNKFGKGHYSITVYDKVKRIVFSMDSKKILYITTEPEADHDAIIKKLMKL